MGRCEIKIPKHTSQDAEFSCNSPNQNPQPQMPLPHKFTNTLVYKKFDIMEALVLVS